MLLRFRGGMGGVIAEDRYIDVHSLLIAHTKLPASLRSDNFSDF